MKNKIKFANDEIVILALYLLGGHSKLIHLEEIAMKADEIAPGRFRWIHNKEMISDSNIWDALSNARQKKKKGQFVTSSKSSWILTDQGINFAKKNINKIDRTINTKEREDPTIRKKRNLALTRIINSQAYKLLNEKKVNEILLDNLEEVFKINDYMTENKKIERIQSLKSLFLNDTKTLKIIKSFEQLMNEKIQ